MSLRKGSKGFLGVRYPGLTPVLRCCDLMGNPVRMVGRVKGSWEGRRGEADGSRVEVKEGYQLEPAVKTSEEKQCCRKPCF